jgi:small-conductance mechanosensitive channel
MLVLYRSDRHFRLASVIVVCPDTDIETLLPPMAEAMQGIPRILKTPAPTASLVRFIPEGLELEAGFWIADPENGSGGVRSAVNFELWRLCRQRGARLPGQKAGELPVKDETDKSLIHKPLSLSEDENQA